MEYKDRIRDFIRRKIELFDRQKKGVFDTDEWLSMIAEAKELDLTASYNQLKNKLELRMRLKRNFHQWDENEYDESKLLGS